ncbi:MAG: tail fiber domain-containing protein [Phycisphaerales bacterium]
MLSKIFRNVVALSLAVCAGSSFAPAQSAVPTYQGTLKSSGMAASGSFDFRLSLYSAETGGTALQQALLNGIEVSGGIFTLPLNFDPVYYSGSQSKFIGVEVRPAGGSSYTALSPRQALGAAPMALSVPGVERIPTLTVDQDIAASAPASGGATLAANSNVWQSITSTATGYLRSIRVRVATSSGLSRPLNVTVFAGEGVSGAVLATGAGTLPANIDDGRLVEIPVFPAVAVTPGAKITVRIRSTSTLARWMISTTDVYAGGISSVSTSQDLGIQTLVETTDSIPAIRASGGLFTSALQVGDNIGGTQGSAVASYAKQVELSGEYNTGPNIGQAVKLLINDYDNEEGSDIYPIYVEDENNLVDFFIRKVGSTSQGTTTAFLNGNLGLGNAAPNARLHIGSPTVASSDFQLLMTNSTVASNAFKTSGMRVTNDGFFEITNNANNGATAVLARLSSVGIWTSTSDARLKTDITPAQGMLEAALKVRPVRYKWRADGAKGGVQLGVIAQEVRAALPEFVEGDEQTGTLSVNYPGLGVVAIGAVQEQQSQINTLKARLAASETDLATMRKQASELTARLEKLEQSVSASTGTLPSTASPASTLRR